MNDVEWKSLEKAIKESYGIEPKNVHGSSIRKNYYVGKLTDRIKALFECEFDESWDKDYVLENLIRHGVICVTDTSMGVIALKCQPYGHNVYDRPSSVIISNVVLGTLERTIGVDCELIYLFDNRKFKSFTEMINIYAEKLALIDSSIETNLVNTKLAYLIDCVDSKQATEAKMIIDKISRGEPAVFYTNTNSMDTSNKITIQTTHVKEQYIVDMLQEEKHSIMNEFLSEIGVNHTSFEKKERLLVDEINSNNDQLQINMKYVKNNIEDCVKRVKTMFPNLSLKIDLPLFDKENYRGEQNDIERPTSDMGIEEQSE